MIFGVITFAVEQDKTVVLTQQQKRTSGEMMLQITIAVTHQDHILAKLIFGATTFVIKIIY